MSNSNRRTSPFSGHRESANFQVLYADRNLKGVSSVARSHHMKITINIDCTPAEARQYMGLPDVAPMQEAMLKELQERMMANVDALQPAEMIKAWLPMGMENWLEMQEAFWKQMTSIGRRGDDNS
jgi:uncharacterized protein DUF6489